MLNHMVGWIVPALLGVIWVLFIVKIIKNRCAPVKKVKAQLVEKYHYTPVSKYNVKEVYVIVFETEGKKLSFNVPEFSYNGYKVKKNGTLKYKGDRIIGFE